MNKLRSEAQTFARGLAQAPIASNDLVELFVIPPFTAVAGVAEALSGTRVRVGVQNVHWAESGAWTGEISAAMAVDCGATIAEIGHSERRAHFGETDATVGMKVAAALAHEMTPLVCVGETGADHAAGRTGDVLARQVAAAVGALDAAAAARVVFAYEPVWAIGEGATPAQPSFANEQHAHIKALARAAAGAEVRVVYGGSVSGENCVALAAQPHIDGLFIGRSAWELGGFLAIAQAVASERMRAARAHGSEAQR